MTFCRALLLVLATTAWSAQAADFVTQISPGVFVHYGKQEDSVRANLGDIANIGFIVGEKCVAVIDTGGTFTIGQSLRKAIQSATALPVCHVINTHVHPDHIFGNAAFSADKPQFVGHTKLAAAMSNRGGNYSAALKRDFGDAAQGSEVIPPTLTVQDKMKIDLGGRTLELRAWKTAHTDHDLTVYDEKTKTLWLGDLVFVDRIPVVDGNLKGWLAALQELGGMQVTRVVPGHGKSDKPWPELMQAQQRYLSGLATQTRAAIKANKNMQQAMESVGQDLRQDWLLFDLFHRRNVAAAFAELEWDD